MTEPDHHRPEVRSVQHTKGCSQSVRELHELYCHWTAQNLTLRFDRERLWYEFLGAGFSAADLKRVLTYLQIYRRTQTLLPPATRSLRGRSQHQPRPAQAPSSPPRSYTQADRRHTNGP